MPAQRQGGTAPVVSPEVHADGRVTFRITAPRASEVTVSGDFAQGRQALTKDPQGVWSVTVGPLAPDLYSYSFSIDSLGVADPINPSLKLSPRNSSSLFEVPADQPQFFDPRPVPYGTVHLNWYQSQVLGALRCAYVYTPPGYEKGKDRYPVFYLLHGAGDTESEWVLVGRANLILDNLIAEGQARPMVVVMPFGYPQGTVKLGLSAPANPDRNLFTKDLVEDLMPMVERLYRVSNQPDQRAIAGLSMGAGQSLNIGLNRLDLFHWIGAFSSAVRGQEAELEKSYAALLANPAAANKKIRLLWIACGKQDGLFAANRSFSDLLKKHEIKHTFVATEGAHQWQVWRRNLNEIVPLLFAR
jgi:enterochelin esterase family protein